jgi:hypothetical protein
MPLTAICALSRLSNEPDRGIREDNGTRRPHAMPAGVKLDVFGKRMLVEWHDGNWRTFLLGADCKRSVVNISIPDTIAEADLVQYFDDIYHEAATPQRPAVVRLP